MSKELSGNTKTLVDSYLVPMLNGLMDIEVHDEIGRIKADTYTTSFAFQNWNSDVRPIIIKNGTIKTETTDYRADYDNGEIRMVVALVAGDEITSSYRFELFNRHTLADFYNRALSFFNGVRPSTSYTLENIPDEWVDALTTSAYKYALQSIALTAMTWRGKLIFPDPSAVLSTANTLIASIAGDMYTLMLRMKGRSAIQPHSVATGRWRTPQSVNQTNWQQYTTIRAGG